MRPLVMMTVPFSIGGPLTGKTLPPVMAMVCADARAGGECAGQRQ
jgi:hypothetical protein